MSFTHEVRLQFPEVRSYGGPAVDPGGYPGSQPARSEITYIKFDGCLCQDGCLSRVGFLSRFGFLSRNRLLSKDGFVSRNGILSRDRFLSRNGFEQASPP